MLIFFPLLFIHFPFADGIKIIDQQSADRMVLVGIDMHADKQISAAAGGNDGTLRQGYKIIRIPGHDDLDPRAL